MGVFTTIDFYTAIVNSNNSVTKEFAKRDFISIEDPSLFASKNALDENLTAISYQEFDVDMTYYIPTPIMITNYIDLNSFLASIGKIELAEKAYFSKEDIAIIIKLAKDNKEQLEFTKNIQR